MKHQKHLLVLLLFAATNVAAQFSERLSFHVEFMSNNSNVTLRDNWPIRQDVGDSYSNLNSSNRVYTNAYFTQIGFRPEYELIRNKLSVSTGIRFSHILNEVEKYNSENGGYFFLRYGNNPLITEYARVKSISEQTSYLGIPLEFQLTPFRYYKLAPYMRIGSEIGFKISTSNEINFYNNAMNEYASEIMQQYSYEPQSTFATIYSALGLSLGSADKINYNIEFLLPSVFLTNRNSSLLEIDQYQGVRLSIKLPLSELKSGK